MMSKNTLGLACKQQRVQDREASQKRHAAAERGAQATHSMCKIPPFQQQSETLTILADLRASAKRSGIRVCVWLSEGR